jgi:hypothetical protein
VKVAAEIVAGLYEGTIGTFREDLEAHLLHGYVFSTPGWFVMGRPVDSTASAEAINDPWHVFPLATHDCWFIHAYAHTAQINFRGLVENVLRVMPYELPLAAWMRMRDERVRIYSIQKLRSWTTMKSPTPR